MLNSIVDTLTSNISNKTAVCIALLFGASYVVYTYGAPVAFGYGAFWDNPITFGGYSSDASISLSGYYWIAQDSWRWPLLSLPHAASPDRVNGFLFDPIPILALIAKLIRSFGGGVVNLFPLWRLAAFALNATALVALVRSLGQRSVLATILAAGMGSLAPFVHVRSESLPLIAQWLPVFSLVLYVIAKRAPELGMKFLIPAGVLVVLATFVNLYLYVMTAAIIAAGLVQAAFDRRASLPTIVVGLALIIAGGVVPLWAFGALTDTSLLVNYRIFGYYSMNISSLFWPQTSGLFQWTGIYYLTRGSIGATSGQYEGYAYLGFGAILLIVWGAGFWFRKSSALLRRNWVLLLALLVLTGWALSNRIYAGPYLVAYYEVPDFLQRTVLTWVRSSGRFIRPIAWLLMALGIVGTLSTTRPRTAVAVTIVALVLQWADLSLWRSRISMIVAGPFPTVFESGPDRNEALNDMATRHRVTIIPSYWCLADLAQRPGVSWSRTYWEIQLMAARADATMYAPISRTAFADCAGEQNASLSDLADDGVLIVLNQPRGVSRIEEAEKAFACRPMSIGVFCLKNTK